MIVNTNRDNWLDSTVMQADWRQGYVVWKGSFCLERHLIYSYGNNLCYNTNVRMTQDICLDLSNEVAISPLAASVKLIYLAAYPSLL